MSEHSQRPHDRVPSTSDLLATGALAFVVFSALRLLATQEFTFSGMLIQDDAIYLGRALFRDPMTEVWTVSTTLPLLNATTGAFESVVAGKVLSIGAAAIWVSTAAVLLSVLTGRKALSIVASTVIIGWPLSPEVGVFALGAHPYFAGGAVVVSAHLFLVARGLSWPRMGPRTALVWSGVFAFLAVTLSPTATLMVFAPMIWLVATAWRSGRPKRALVGDAAIAALPGLGAIAVGVFDYHYRSIPGWTDTSIQSGLDSLARAIATIIEPVLAATLPLKLLYAVGVTLALIAVASQKSKSVPQVDDPEVDSQALSSTRAKPDHLLRDSITVLVIAGALTFGPAYAVAHFTTRYAVLPFILVSLAVAVALLRMTSDMAGRMVAASLIAVLTAGAIRSTETVEAAYGDDLDTHNHVAGLVGAEVDRWKPNSQIVLLVPTSADVPTDGYNHWSTWYLRTLTGRDDIIGLLGHERWLSEDPFVEQYQDHGDEYWTTSENGVGRRIQMKGIVPERPLYAYSLAPDGSWEPAASTFFLGAEATVPFGTRPLNSSVGSPQESCNDEGFILYWPMSPCP